MKKTLLATLLVLAAIAAHAAPDTTWGGAVRAPELATKITVVKSSTTTQGVSIATQTATSVIVDKTQMYSQVCVQNFDTTSYLACSENANVSALTSSPQVGTIIPAAPTAISPAVPTCFGVVPGYDFFCISSSVSAPSKAGITRVR